MRWTILVFLTLLCSCQGTDVQLRSDLENLHAKWLQAFDTGDGSTMDEIEMDNLALVMYTGEVWFKPTARAGLQQAFDPQAVRTLNDASVRRFGDAAVLTGVLTTKSVHGNWRWATTVLFVRKSNRWKIASVQWTPVPDIK